MELWQRQQVRAVRGPWNIVSLSAAAMTAWLAAPLSVLAQDNVVATATLPHDLSVQSMFLNANAVVQAGVDGPRFPPVRRRTVVPPHYLYAAFCTQTPR